VLQKINKSHVFTRLENQIARMRKAVSVEVYVSTRKIADELGEGLGSGRGSELGSNVSPVYSFHPTNAPTIWLVSRRQLQSRHSH